MGDNRNLAPSSPTNPLRITKYVAIPPSLSSVPERHVEGRSKCRDAATECCRVLASAGRYPEVPVAGLAHRFPRPAPLLAASRSSFDEISGRVSAKFDLGMLSCVGGWRYAGIVGSNGARVTDSDDNMMIPDTRAAEIAAISRQRLLYWAKTDLVKPDTERKISSRNVVRLYSLARLVELVAASELRHQGVSLQHIRRIINYLQRQGYESPLRELRFALSGERVLFQHDDGTWEDSRRPFQGVMWQVIDLEAIRSRVQGRLQRGDADAGVIEKRRKVQASKPVFRGTRVPVDAVRRYLEAGKTTAEILEAFPSLTAKDIEAAEASSSAVA